MNRSERPWEQRGLRAYYMCMNAEDPDAEMGWDVVFAYTQADVETGFAGTLVEAPMTDGDWERVAEEWVAQIAKIAKKEDIEREHRKVVRIRQQGKRG